VGRKGLGREERELRNSGVEKRKNKNCNKIKRKHQGFNDPSKEKEGRVKGLMGKKGEAGVAYSC